MILQLPTLSQEISNRLHKVRREAAEINAALADAEFAGAADIARQVWGADAVAILLDLNTSVDGTHAADVLIVLDHNGEPLWFNANSYYEASNYPGAKAISDDRGCPVDDVKYAVTGEIAGHVEAGYEAFDGVHGALDVSYDKHFDPDTGINLLVLNIGEALA